MFLATLLSCQCNAQSPAPAPSPSLAPARALDALLQEYAYRAFVNPRTGSIYDGQVPSNLTGIKISVVRLRSGSLRNRGMMSFKEFKIPNGVDVEPRVERMAFVYQNLGNWSSVYYPLPGFTYLTPVLGLLAYNAANLTGTGLSELDVRTSGSSIIIDFRDVIRVLSGATPLCVWFELDGLPAFRNLEHDNVCSTEGEGHFAIVVNSTGLSPAPAPAGGVIPGPASGTSHKSKSKTWKIVGGVVGGFVVLVLVVLLLVCALRYRKKKKVAGMERQAEAGETLQMSQVGNSQAPVASGTRTQAAIENEYAP